MNDHELKHIASLLDDDDELVAVNALAELLERGKEIGDLSSVLQESENPKIRRRIHQLQAALNFRQRRVKFARMLKNRNPNLIEGLIDVHSQWFDWDLRSEVEKAWREIKDKAVKRSMRSLSDIGCFMHRMNFVPENETTMRPENYCIGTILEQRYGSSALLAAIGRELLDEPENFRVIKAMGLFCIQDQYQHILPVTGEWQVQEFSNGQLEIWNNRDILRLALLSLFSCAVNSDSYRYVLTIAQALTGDMGDDILEYFPYPYHSNYDNCSEGDGDE